MTERKRTCLQGKLGHLSVEQMDEMLQAELEKEKPEEGVVLPILMELEKRENQQPVEPGVIESRKKRRRSAFAAGIAAAAVLCIVLFLPQTVGAESFFDVIARWTKDAFCFADPDKEGNMPQTVGFSTENPDLQRVYDQMTELGATAQVVPMWVPEGFDLVELKVTPMSSGEKLYAKFVKDGRIISLSYRVSADLLAPQYEKKDASVEKFETAGVKHYILINDEMFSVTWVADNTECSMVTDVEREDVYGMIRSIYRRNIS